MKAIILAAGKGTRLWPITSSMPKPMVPILNKPVMEFLVELLSSHGFRKVMVNTSYLAREIESYFRDGSRFGVEMAYSFEGYLENDHVIAEPVGSAGALKRIQEHSGFFDDTFVVLCGDAIVDIDLTELVRFHREKGAVATLALLDVPRERVSSYGVAVTDGDGRIIEFQEKPSEEDAKSTMVSTGVYVLEPEVIDWIPSMVPLDLGGQLFPTLVQKGVALYGAKLPFQWLDIGNVSDYHNVVQMALKGEINGLPIPGIQVSQGIWTSLNIRADFSRTRIEPPVYVGGSTTLEPGCTIIGPTVVGSGCVVESGAHIARSVIFDYTRIRSGAEAKNMIVCGGSAIEASGVAVDLDQSTIGWVITDARRPQHALINGHQFPQMHQRFWLEA